MRRFLLNVISNKVVAKIHTDLQVFTTYQEVFALFWCLQEAEWLLNQMHGLFYIKPRTIRMMYYNF